MEIMEQVIKNMLTTDMQMKDDDDYIENGLLYCGKCRTPKQSIIHINNKEIKVPCSCECESREYERQREIVKARERQEYISNLKKMSLIGKRYEDVTFDKCQNTSESFARAKQRCMKYCSIADEALDNGYGIYIFGNSGVGKTLLTACMCNELTNQVKQCLFTNFFEISKSIRATFNSREESEERLVDRLCDIDFLFIDDLGTERVKSNGDDTWLQEKIYDIINKRYNAKKPTIFTSNYNLNDLINRGMMDKTVDRIYEMSTAIIKIEGSSYRKKVEKKSPF